MDAPELILVAAGVLVGAGALLPTAVRTRFGMAGLSLLVVGVVWWILTPAAADPASPPSASAPPSSEPPPTAAPRPPGEATLPSLSLELDEDQGQRFVGVDLDTGGVRFEEDDSLDVAVDVNGRLRALHGSFGRPDPSDYGGEDVAADLAACVDGGLAANQTSAIDVNDLQPGQLLCAATDQGSAVALLTRQHTRSVYAAPLIMDVAISRAG